MIEYTVEVCDNGINHWYLNGERHREDGPAIEHADGSKSWFLNGNQYPKGEFKIKSQKHKELTVKEVEDLLGYQVKIIK